MTRCFAPSHLPAFAALALLGSPGLALAQGAATQKVTGPQARYWIAAETGTGLTAAAMQGGGGLGAVMSSLFGGSGPVKTLRLELGGVREGSPAEALHAIPAGMAMGASLQLLGPERAAPAPERSERDVPEVQGERPKGRILFFWGCGETAGPGQPVVIDFEKIAQGVLPANLRSVTVQGYRGGPGFGRDKGFAEWPHRRTTTGVPVKASLVGDHTVQGNFVPEIRFAVDAGHDFMEPLNLSRSKSASGAQALSWNRPASALGYFVTGMGVRDNGSGASDMVMWNSSASRLLGGEQLNTFLPPAETERLVKSGVVLAAEVTQCVVPKEVLAAAGGELLMTNLNAFGPELNVVHPPRPQDPKVTWEQQYQVRLRLRSFTGAIGGMDGAAAERPSGEEKPRAAKDEKPANPAEAVKGLLKGILGR